MTDLPKKCICKDGKTIEFRGKGQYLQFRICPLVDTEGHLTMDQCEEKYKEEKLKAYPASGRFS